MAIPAGDLQPTAPPEEPPQPEAQAQPPQVNATPLAAAPLGGDDASFDKWIENFYKECGREVTLAYTTLNQMKNWAMAIVAAFISAIVALGKPGEATVLAPAARLGIYAAAVVAYVFNIRFFIRAILCYINLLRWNRLQSDIVSAYLIPKPLELGERLPTKEQARDILRREIEDYLHRWRSPISRKNQIFQNLKLGFALVLALPLFFVIVWSVELWELAIVRGLAVFAAGTTLVEMTDFARSSYFDTPERSASRRRGKRAEIFPVPVSQGGYLLTWFLNLLLSATVALWPTIQSFLCCWMGCK